MSQGNKTTEHQNLYLKLIATLDEVNTPPGGYLALVKLISNWPNTMKKGVDIGCNTGTYTLEVANLTGAKTIGIDISAEMIASAKRRKIPHPIQVEFIEADATSLPYKHESLDFVFSGGSTAFIPNREKAYNEYYRVIRPGGIVSELNFYYETSPPKDISIELSKILGFDIPIWDKDDWITTYKAAKLEPVHEFIGEADLPCKQPETYVNELIKEANVELKPTEIEYLTHCFEIFEQNNKYLKVLGTIYRKPIVPYQTKLFSKKQ